MINIKDIQEKLAPLFKTYGVTNAVVFGSIAKGCADEKSDLDLLVDSGLKGLKFVGLTEAIKDAVGMPVDVFDKSHIEENSRIAREISETGVRIYEG